MVFSLIKDGVLRLTDYEGTVLSMDLEGRVMIYAKNGTTYRRTLQDKYLEIKYINGKREVRMLGSNEGREIGFSALEFINSCSKKVEDNSVKDILKYIINKGSDFLADDARKFIKIYGGEIPIVPPDQYFPIYLQATIGCYWDKCTFCNLYRGKRYSVRSFEEFADHISKVKEFFGRGISARRGIFMGDANSININQDLLTMNLKLMNRELELPMYSFVDSITTQKVKTMADLFEIGKLGIKRIYLGLETGSKNVLKLLNKPIDLNETQRFIIAAKHVGISIGIITLAGAGGKRYYREHVESTSEFISSLPLDRNDIIYISPLYIYQSVPYAEISQQVGEMTRPEEEQQFAQLKIQIREKYRLAHGSELFSPVALYDLVESIY